jgi:hypothetical protein
MMSIRDDVLNFIKEEDFTDQSINNFLDSSTLDTKALIRNSFKVLNLYIADLVPTKKDEEVISKSIELLSILCDNYEFKKEEIDAYKTKVKKTREALLAIANKYNNLELLNQANKLDEIVIDKNIDVNDLILLIEELIDKKEEVNIIKKLISINKCSILSKDNELFDYVFNKAIVSIKNNDQDKFYYITLLKIVYNSRIDKLKYVLKLNESVESNNVFANEIYMIIHGVKRSLSTEEILEKYNIEEDLPSRSIFVPKNSYYDDHYLMTIDNNDTYIRDDAISIKKDGNNYVLGIHISDLSTKIKMNSSIDRAARNNFECKFLSGGKRTQLYNTAIENTLSLDENTYRSLLSLYIIITGDGTVKDYFFVPNDLIINKNLTYSSGDAHINNHTEEGKMLSDLYSIALSLQNKNKSRIEYWKIKYLNNNYTDDNPKCDTIVREFMILYNTLIANKAKSENIPFVYRVQDPEYISDLIKSHNIEINDYTDDLIKKIYLDSKYSSEPRKHTGLNTSIYSKSTSPLRRYPDYYNQCLFHHFYIKDLDMDFDYDKHIELINYFNQRSVELALMSAEYNREMKLSRKK